jgi:aldehyde dehydrogenase (NAD+)
MDSQTQHERSELTDVESGAMPQAQRGWEYSPAPERAKVEIADRYGLYIDGAFVEPISKKHFASINPATEETLSIVAEAGPEDVDAAVEAAKTAQPKWARLKPQERAKYLFRIARRIQERARELAILETMDGGKPIKESRDVDLPLVAQHFFYHAGWCDKLLSRSNTRNLLPLFTFSDRTFE